MTCCGATYQNFGGQAVTVVPYVGAKPVIEVMYFIDGVLKSAAHSIKITPTEIIIDHGGPSTGVIKLS